MRLLISAQPSSQPSIQITLSLLMMAPVASNCVLLVALDLVVVVVGATVAELVVVVDGVVVIDDDDAAVAGDDDEMGD